MLPIVAAGDYVGAMTLGADGAIDVVVDIRSSFQRNAQIPLRFEAEDDHAAELRAAVPDLRTGETRHLFRDPHGRLKAWP